MPVDDASLAGYVAGHGEPVNLDDAYAVPAGAPYRHNTAFDEQTGWRTRAMLVVPMSDHTGALVGVLQLMNRRLAGGDVRPLPGRPRPAPPLPRDAGGRLGEGEPADRLDPAPLRGLRPRRDHGRRAPRPDDGRPQQPRRRPLRRARARRRPRERRAVRLRPFSREELRELQTAALLHDFGKISIPERVLVKAKKLDEDDGPEDPRPVRLRPRGRGRARRAGRSSSGSLEAGVPPSAEDVRQLDLARWERAQELEELFEEIRRANEPTVLPESRAARCGGS